MRSTGCAVLVLSVTGFALLTACDGCGSDPGTSSRGGQPTEPVGGERASPPAEAQPDPGREAASDERPIARLKVGSDSEGLPLGAGEVVTAADQAAFAIDFRDGARAELGPHTRVRIGDESPAELFLGTGHVRATLPPAGNSPRPPLRIATAEVSVVVARSGDVWVACLPGGGTWTAAISGRVELSTGRTEPEGRLVRRSLVAGQALVVRTGELGEPVRGPTKEDEARARLAALQEDAGRRAAAGSRPAAPEDVLRLLDEAVKALEEERERGKALEAAHRVALERSEAKARRLRHDLVEHAQALFRLRRIVLTRWERLRARSLVEGEELEADALARTARVRQALGISIPAVR